MYRSLQLLVTALAFTFMTAGVRAQESNAGAGPDKKGSVGLLLGYGIGFDDTNFWGFGLGVRGGYNIGPIYLGGRFVYHFGETDEAPLGLGEATANMWQLSLEGGYDFMVAPNLTVRPEIGMGLAMTMVDIDAGSGGIGASYSESSGNFMMAFGASLLYDITPMWFAGVDTRLEVIIGDESLVAMVFLLNAGLRF